MPTGYTANIKDGIGFDDFVWQCARGMGALVMMRDAPADAPIPERFEPSDYHAKKREEAEQELQRLTSLSDQEVAIECKNEYMKDRADKAKRLEENEQLIKAYESMRSKVLEWEPPTPDHVQFKQFMIDQLNKSIEFDDSRGFLVDEEMPHPSRWLSDRIALTARNVEYHNKAHQEEIDRTNARNEWVAQLRQSLAK